MKKTISIFLIVAMLLSCVVFALPASALATADYIDYKEALYFETAPTIDGYISEAEWGQHTVFVEAWDCATIDDNSPYYNFFYNRISATNRDDYGDFSYYIWLRWDLNKFYIGVKVDDPDGHSNKNGSTNTWNGDAVQTRIDKNGANAIVNGGDFTVTADRQKPWGSTSVPDFLFGYVQIAGGFSEAWENTNNKGMTSFSNNPLGVAQCVVAPAGSAYSSDTQAGITTYEIAIPWTYIFNGEYESLEMKQYSAGRDTATKGPRGAIGKELGMSLVVLNDGADANAGWDAAMCWGSGVLASQHEEGAAACSGSNSVVLVDTPVAQTAGYLTYDPTELLDAKFTTDHLEPAGTFYDYLAGDTEETTPMAYDSLSSLTYDDEADLSVWGAPEYMGSISNIGGTHGNVLDYSDPHLYQTYIATQDGYLEYLFPLSYTFEFDIMFTGVEQVFEGYGAELYNWFGGSTVCAFQCGYFFNDGAFKIVNTYDNNEVLAYYRYDLKKDTWYNWKFQYDNDSCNARLWIDDLSTEADNVESGTEGTAGYTGAGGTLVINSHWRYFYYSGEKELTDGTPLMFRMMNTQVMFDNVKIYNFATSFESVESGCKHVNTREEITPPTCTTGGSYKKICVDCGEILAIQGSSPDASHHKDPVLVGNTEPTCTSDGYTGDYICPDCNEILASGEPIPATGHSYDEDVTPPVCTEDGYTTYTCHCGDSYVDDYVDALGHSFTNYVSNNDATYTADGTKTAVCDRCDVTDTIVDEGSMLEALSGWIQEDGKWAYYENGVKLTNQWKKDSIGWRYVGSDGYVVYDQWVKDSYGWCYLGSDGYMVCNQWIQDDSGWYDDGWYYVDSYGHRVHGTVLIDGEFYSFDSNGICLRNTIQYSVSNGEVTITGYIGNPTELVIPEIIEGYPVTAIATEAFGWCYSLESITIPESVTTIGNHAFTGCSGLTSITIPDSITSIGNEAFNDCTSLSTVYYGGSEADWNNISVETANDYLLNANIIFAKAEVSLNGWIQEDGKWAYYVDNEKLTSCWKQDSKGWCYLGADGYMVTNAWLKDSKGWCYVGADGYCATNCWKKDSIGWIWLDSEGSMTNSKWILDGGKWYYLDENGYMVSNQWRKDSKGWCWLTASGAMATNQWVKDSKGWCYIEADGYCATNCWKKDSIGWIWLDSEGSMTKNKWLLDGGKWYYLDSNGYMVTGKKLIGGTYYTFNSSGVWVG